MPLSLASGTDQVITRSVLLSVLQRSKALGGGSTGSFDLILTVRGKDGIGNDVQGSVTVPVAVSSAPPSTLSLVGVSVEVPASPYNLGDTVNERTRAPHRLRHGDRHGTGPGGRLHLVVRALLPSP